MLDVTTPKHGIIPTERETVERGITKDSTNEQRRALGGSKEERFRTAIDDIEEAIYVAYIAISIYVDVVTNSPAYVCAKLKSI